jgi:sigma-B regulation protein RsbU (phosphoserine phosphatase)
LSYINAGHLPGYLLDHRGEMRERLPSTGTPLGLFAGRRFADSRSLPLEPGDMIVLFTDGITESSAAGGEEFGAQRALEFIKAHRELPARQIARQLTRAARGFAAHAPQVDDMGVFVCKLSG